MSYGGSKELHWPPKSPHETLLTSPSRRKKLLGRERETSPSPTKPPRSASKPASLQTLYDSGGEDDDEETLQLKLEAIQARLKLKKIQQAKARQAAATGNAPEARTTQSSDLRSSSYSKRDGSPQATVKVPVSPTRDRKAPSSPTSPARVLLGIDKGMRARDVSLRRVSNLSARLGNSQRQHGLTLAKERRTAGTLVPDITAARPKSFSECIAESRASERDKKEKQDRISSARSKTFGRVTVDLSSASSGLHSQQSHQRFDSRSRSALGKTSSLSDPDLALGTSGSSSSSYAVRSGLRENDLSGSDGNVGPHGAIDEDKTSSSKLAISSLFESYSGVHLSKSLITHDALTRLLDGKAVYNIPQLLKEVKSPHYDPPDVESDYVVLGIIASKSNPLEHKSKLKEATNEDPDAKAEQDQAAGRGKFMVMKLTDLHWELDMFLFASGFSEFWKLTVGTVVAILNPGIMPPKNRDAGNFTLKLSSSEDTILQIGTARDLGFCTAMKRDGKECTTWVDLRKTEVCEFHVSLAIEKSKRGRMEVNTMTGFGSRSGGKHGMFSAGKGKGIGGTKRSDEIKREGMWRDKSLHETMFIAPNAAKLLDNEDKSFGGGFESRLSKAEATKRRRTERKRENQLAKKLGDNGTGLGGEYMRMKAGEESKSYASKVLATSTDVLGAKVDAASLGLINRNASEVSLGHANKRKRALNSGSEPMGWGGALKRGLPSPMKTAELNDTSSPTKKRAKFVLEGKGIREPGRESLGGEAHANLDLDDDDDDDGLEII